MVKSEIKVSHKYFDRRSDNKTGYNEESSDEWQAARESIYGNGRATEPIIITSFDAIERVRSAIDEGCIGYSQQKPSEAIYGSLGPSIIDYEVGRDFLHTFEITKENVVLFLTSRNKLLSEVGLLWSQNNLNEEEVI